MGRPSVVGKFRRINCLGWPPAKTGQNDINGLFGDWPTALRRAAAPREAAAGARTRAEAGTLPQAGRGRFAPQAPAGSAGHARAFSASRRRRTARSETLLLLCMIL